jgi:hypothetical protein
MTAGIPGVGLGGFFYLLCVPIMLIYELSLLLRGKSSRKRWHIIFHQMCMTIFMIIGILCIDKIIDFILLPHDRKLPPSVHVGTIHIYHNIYVHPVFIPLMLMSFIITTILLMQIFISIYRYTRIKLLLFHKP